MKSRPCWNPAPKPSPLVIANRGESSVFMATAFSIRRNDRWESVSGLVQIYVNGHVLDLHSGDRVEIVGSLNSPTRPTNPGEFNFYEKSRSERCLSILYVDHPDAVTKTFSSAGWSVSRFFDDLRGYLDRQLWKYVHPDRAPIASAILLGNRTQIETTQRDVFMETGTVHLLAISGLHVGILAASILLFARIGLVPRSVVYWLTIGVVLFYMVLVEYRPPVVRASILVTLYCLSKLWNRKPITFNSLAFSAVVVLAINPSQLFQTGAQLSFLAVATIIAVQPFVVRKPLIDPLDRLIDQTLPVQKKVTNGILRYFYELFAISLVIWIVTMPLVASRFHIVAPIGIVLNPILMIPIAMSLVGGFGVLVLSWLLPPVGTFAGKLCDFSLWMIQSAIDSSHHLFFSHFWTAGFSDFWLAVFYGGLLLILVFRFLNKTLIVPSLFAATWFVLASLLPSGLDLSSAKTSDELRCTFIDVGHGTSVLLEFPCGRTMLYDGGSLTNPRKGARSIASVLWSKHVTHLDTLIVSHADADHYNAVPELLDKFSVGEILVSPLMYRKMTPAVTFLENAIANSKGDSRVVEAGEQIALDRECLVEVLHPSSDANEFSDNSNSIVLLIRFGDQTILLPGDLEDEGLERLTQNKISKCHIAMSPHHGSTHADHAGFVSWCRPEWVVISSGKERLDPTVLAPYEERDAHVLNTANCGAIEFRIRKDRISASQFLSTGD